MINIILLLIGYLIGSIPFALVIGKLFYNTDVRNFGSKNLGATNAGRVLGKKAGLAVTILDALKGLIVIIIATILKNSGLNIDPIICALGVLIGHCYPIFANFKGGKAVATSFGIILGINVYLFLIGLACFLLNLKIHKMVSLSSMISLSIIAIISPLFVDNLTTNIILVLIALFVIYKHKANIIRIKNKTESKVKWI